MSMHEVPIPEPEQQEEEWLTFESTAYTAFCDSGCIGITRTGYDVSKTIYYDGMRIIAVDPEVIPLYSVVEIHTGTEIFKAIALDTGGLIRGNIIDLLVETKSEAYQWGRRQVKVRVVEERNIKEFEKCISGNANNVIGKVTIQK